MGNDVDVFVPDKSFANTAHVGTFKGYKQLHKESVSDPDGFWLRHALSELFWYEKPTKAQTGTAPFFKYFEDGVLNVSANCLDRNLATRATKPAIVWEGEPGDTKTLTYNELYNEVNKFANVLSGLGVKKGDRVALYMPMVVELPIAMLACTRIGAIHSIVFGGFSSDSLKLRIQDAEAAALITVDAYYRNGKIVKAFDNVLSALEECESVRNVVVVNRLDTRTITLPESRPYYRPTYHWWDDLMVGPNVYYTPEEMNAEDPLFLLYTSGSTGKPKGVVHTTGGYLLYTHLTYKWIFDYKESDVYWCSADIGWITGHSYIVYGPLSNGSTSFMFEGVPTYPDPGKYWELIDKYSVTVFYTAPTVIRALARHGTDWPNKYSLDSLRLIGTVGEPINHAAWLWYNKYVGKEKCPIVDTWWQTETGGAMVSPLPGAVATKPGSATFPFPGISPKVIRADGTECEPNELGNLVITKPWPGMLRTLWNDPDRYRNTYFPEELGGSIYLTGDEATRDEDGYLWIVGRNDDVINVSGHRLGSAEMESAMVAHHSVSEAAVVGVPHKLKGWTPYCFVVLQKTVHESEEELRRALVAQVRKVIGPIATPEVIQFVDALPKTRSGKIMRRILRKITVGDTDNFGDTSTLINPEVIEKLIVGR